MKDLSIIIVNWNAEKYIQKCLESIIQGTNNLDYEIIVIDNASYDGTEEIIRDAFPNVIFVQSEKNLGFAGANNLGYQYAKGHTLLFLNPDTEILGSAVNILYSRLQSLPQAGAMGCRLLNSDQTLQTSCIQAYPTIFNQVLDIERLKMLSPKLKCWGIRPLFDRSEAPEEVEVVSGACLMMKRAIFEKVGLFSTDYFMYSEDVDLCYKVGQAGYKNYYCDDAEIIHHGGGSTKSKKDNHFAVVLMKESKYRFIKKTCGRSKAQLFKRATSLVSIGRLILMICFFPVALLSGVNKQLYGTFIKWKNILRWSFGLENWVEKLMPNVELLSKKVHCKSDQSDY